MGRRINFVGWYGRGNCGDEAFKAVHEQLFPDCEINWFVEVPPDEARLDATWVLGGGDVFLDYYIRQIPAEAPFFVYGVGLGSPDQIEHIAALRHRIKGIWLRNARDVEMLREVGVDARYSPDIVFQLADAARNRPLPPDVLGKDRKTAVIIPSNNAAQSATRRGDLGDFFYFNYMKIKMGAWMDDLAQYYDLVFLPFSFDENDIDLHFIAEVVGHMKRTSRVQIIKRQLDPLDAARVVADAQLVMSMKFHGLIFAMMMGRPFVNIGLTRKTQLLCEDNGFPQLSIPPYTITHDTLMSAVKQAENPDLLVRLRENAAALSSHAMQEGLLFRDAVLSCEDRDLAA